VESRRRVGGDPTGFRGMLGGREMEGASSVFLGDSAFLGISVGGRMVMYDMLLLRGSVVFCRTLSGGDSMLPSPK